MAVKHCRRKGKKRGSLPLYHRPRKKKERGRRISSLSVSLGEEIQVGVELVPFSECLQYRGEGDAAQPLQEEKEEKEVSS